MLNKVMLIGHLGVDPDLRYTQNGTAVASFSLASAERWKGPDGQPQEHTEWHRIVAWAGLAEICHQYLKKGSRVFVEGKLRTKRWQDQNGADRYTTEILAHDMKILSPRALERDSEAAAPCEDPSYAGSSPPDGIPSF